MSVWLSHNGASLDAFANKRAFSRVDSVALGRLDSLGELVNWIDSKDEQDGTWHYFESLRDYMRFWVRDDVCDFVQLDNKPGVRLDIVYHSQNDADSLLSPNDCGPASSVMMLERAGIVSTVDAFMRKAGINHGGFTSFSDNIRGLSEYGLNATVERPFHISSIIKRLQAGEPVMNLVRYNHLRPGQNYGHFLVTVGYRYQNKALSMLVHDPNDAPYVDYPIKQYGLAIGYSGASENMPFQSLVVNNYPDFDDIVSDGIVNDEASYDSMTKAAYRRAVLQRLDNILTILSRSGS